jgi:hypothetical protein
MKDTYKGKDVHEVHDKIRISRNTEEEYFAIETKIVAPVDAEITKSRVIFSLPDSHPVFEVDFGPDLSVGIGSDGFIGAVIRLKPEWFWEEEQEFDYHITITTSNGNYEETGRAVVQ